MGGLMRRLMLVVLAISVATGLAASASLSAASEATEAPPAPPPAGGTSANVSSDPYFQVVDNAAELDRLWPGKPGRGSGGSEG